MPAASSLNAHQGLIALQAPVKLGGEGEMPTRLLMLKWGTNETAIGPKVVGLKTLQASQLWGRLGYGEVAIDFNHNTVPGHASYRGEPAPIAGMGRPRVIEGEGLVFENIRWTPEGIANRANYPDLSPAVKDDADGEVIFVHSAALARNGAVQDLHLFSAESIPADLAAKLLTLSAQPENPNPMTAILDLLKKLLKLPADATEADITTALETAVAAPEEKPAVASDEVKAMNAALLTALTAVKGEFGTQITALNARFDNQLRDQIVADATATGRVIPAEWLPGTDGQGGLPLDQLRTLCATLPEVVPMERRTPASVITLSASLASSADEQVRKTLGISKEAWEKHASA